MRRWYVVVLAIALQACVFAETETSRQSVPSGLTAHSVPKDANQINPNGQYFAASDIAQIKMQLQRHERAVYIKSGWIRDPYIYLAPDGYYYLTGTTPLSEDKRQVEQPYNTGLGNTSIVGYKMALWRSLDLAQWEYLGTPYSLKDGIWYHEKPELFNQADSSGWRLWAPEIIFARDRWIIVSTSPKPVNGGNLSITKGSVIEGPYENPIGPDIGKRHDPSLFKDDDGQIWLIWGAIGEGIFKVAPLKSDFSGFAAEPASITPANRKMGHEGACIRKIGGKYVFFGTAWSTDKGRHGTYNLYYCVADKITGPYGERKFAGRFLGHGTPFLDKNGRWWCTAFYNANVGPLNPDQLKTMDMSDNAYTINQQGVTLVPLDVKVLKDGTIEISAKDSNYSGPGKEETQTFLDKH